MKKCPKCGQVYTDKDLNFCYNDGELLSYLADDAPPTVLKDRTAFSDDPPATEFMGTPRVTSETNWPPQQQAPPTMWQGGQPLEQAEYSQFPTQVAQNQTLAIVSLGLGIGAMTIGWCCYSGLLLSPVAIVTGVIALIQIKGNPNSYGGRGFAIAGIITALVFLLLFLLVIIITGVANFI
jgi:hypothetical protein